MAQKQNVPPQRGAAQPPKGKRLAKPADLRPVPVWKAPDGTITDSKLKSRMFPSTRDGRVAYCHYRAALWEIKATREMAKGDPTLRKVAKIEKLQKMLALLQQEVAAAKAKV